MKTTAHLISLTLLCALLSAPALAGPEARGQVAKAYDHIKAERGEHLEAYSKDLLELAEECANEGWEELTVQLLGQVRKLHAPPRNRRKVKGESGVMASQGAGPDASGALVAVHRRVESVDVQARRDRAMKRVKEIQGILDKAEKVEPKKADAGKLETKRSRASGRFIDDNMKLAKDCVKRGYPGEAYELLLWALQFDPDNKSLRKKLLKQKPFKNKKGETRWYSAFELKKAKQGLFLHPEYGWVNDVQLKALKAGKLNFRGKWLPKEKVEELRSDWANHWVYETEHYQVKTNAPLADAVEFGREVENLYRFFFRTFVGHYTQEGKRPDASLVFGGGMERGNRKLVLHYLRSRESYLELCRTDPDLKSDPLLLQSAGFYDPNTGKAFFYREADGPDLSTIYHEVTHQIFGETSATGPNPPTWMVEGLAVYMEDPVVRGDSSAGLERLLAGAEPPPGIRREVRNINTFIKTCANRDVFHGSERSENYKTGGAVVHFFMQYHGGIYRQAFTRYVQKAYKNAEPELPTRSDELYQLCGVTPDQLQEQWVEFNRRPDLFDF